MSGMMGFVYRDGRADCDEVLAKMSAALSHRGDVTDHHVVDNHMGVATRHFDQAGYAAACQVGDDRLVAFDGMLHNHHKLAQRYAPAMADDVCGRLWELYRR